MGVCVFTGFGISSLFPTGTGAGKPFAIWQQLRLPTDPLFYAAITLQNIVVGSRYWIAQASDLTNVLASGVAGETTVELTNLPAYQNPMLVEVRIRKASSPVKYKPFVTYGYLVRGGIIVYCAQQEDAVA